MVAAFEPDQKAAVTSLSWRIQPGVLDPVRQYCEPGWWPPAWTHWVSQPRKLAKQFPNDPGQAGKPHF